MKLAILRLVIVLPVVAAIGALATGNNGAFGISYNGNVSVGV